MKMMRWVFIVVAVCFVTLVLFGSPPLLAGTASNPTSSADEHPWDKIKNAYRVQILVITDDYILVAVWYTKDQIQPAIIRIELSQSVRVASGLRPRAKNSYIFTE